MLRAVSACKASILSIGTGRGPDDTGVIRAAAGRGWQESEQPPNYTNALPHYVKASGSTRTGDRPRPKRKYDLILNNQASQRENVQ